jgi:hypothetical protein
VLMGEQSVRRSWQRHSALSVSSESACAGFAMLAATHDDEHADADEDVDDADHDDDL